MPDLNLRPFVSFLAACATTLGGCALTGQQDPAAGAASAGMIASEAPALDRSAQADPGGFEERAREVFGTGSLPRSDLPGRTLDSDLLYKFLLAEIAAQRGNHQVAAQAYLDMARATDDPRIARRATEVALQGRLNGLALEAARLWLATEKDSAAAKQTLAALLVNTNDLRTAKPLLQEMLAADAAEAGPALLQLHGLLARHADKNAVLGLVKELTRPYLKFPEAHFTLSQAALAANKYDAALSSIREALRLRPQWEAAVLFQAQILTRESRVKALEYLRTYLDANPDAQEVRLNYARQLISDKRMDEARAEFQRLLDSNPENADIAVTVALLSLQLNDLDVAEAQLKRVLELDYRDPDGVRFHLGQVSEERKRFDEAEKWYLSVEGGEQFVLAHARYAFMLTRQNRVAEARAHLQSLQPQNDVQRVQLVQSEAQLLREVKAYTESFDLLKAALDARPDHPELLYDLALAAEKIDKLDLVEASLRRLIALKPDNAQAYNALGYTLADRTNRFAEAREYIEKALTLAPDDPFILDSMGWVLYRLGNYSEGVDYLQRAYRQRPDPEIAAHLGEVLWMQGKKAEAERVWRESLRENPDSDELLKVIRTFLP